MKNNFVKAKKYIVIALFLAISVLSVMLVSRVSINYNISDYLDKDTETKIALEIINDEFGATCDIQVMIENISVDSAKEVVNTLKGIDSVLTVSFDENDEGYYKDGNALFVVLVDGDEYSEASGIVLENIKSAIGESFNDGVNYGGAVIEKINLRKSIVSEIPFVLAISICLTVAIMLLTSKSWIEPIVLLLASGVAILINMGTNSIFNSISYITNSVAAILQLALSIDYSIVLLHGYRKMKEGEPDNHKAMSMAVKEVIKPVSASALTTMAGLLALLFMSMKIGFDIGIVLMKGIVISAIVSLTLLPALLLLFDKPLNKTQKRELVFKGKGFCRVAFKAGKIIVPITLALIIACGTLQFGNTYAFTDSSKSNSIIADTFGRNSTIVVVYPNDEDGNKKEIELAEKLSAYKTSAGKSILKKYTAYSSTAGELYDIDLAANKLNLSKSDVELLFTMYHLYNDNSAVEISPLEFVQYTDHLINTDPDAQKLVSEEITDVIQRMLVSYEMVNGEYTAEEFHNIATTGVMEGTDIDLFAIKQMYGLYFYDEIEDSKVSLKDIITFAADKASSGELGDLIDDEAKENLSALADKINQFEEQMNKTMTRSEFQKYMLSDHGVVLDSFTVKLLYAAYFGYENNVVGSTIPLLDLMNFLVDMGQITDRSSISGIEQLNELSELDVAAFRAQMDNPMSASEFQRYLSSDLNIEISELEVMFLFLKYNSSHGGGLMDSIPFLRLMTYLVSSGYVSDQDSIEQIAMLNQLYDSDLEGMQAQLDTPMTIPEFKAYMLEEHGTSLDESKLEIVYAAYFATQHKVVGNSAPFIPLMNYLVEIGQVNDEEAIATINACNKLLKILPTPYSYDELLDSFGDTLEVLAGENVELGFDDSAIQQIYIMYFYDQEKIPSKTISGHDFVNFILETADANAIVGEQISSDTKIKLQDLFTVDSFFSDAETYSFKEMTAKIKELQSEIKSMSASGDLEEDTICGVYIKYAMNSDEPLTAPIAACDLLDFVVENMDENKLLSAKMSDEIKAQVEDAKDSIAQATDLFISDNYSRILLSIDLQSESEESSEFIAFLLNEVKTIFGEDAHIAGEMVSTYDLQITFDDDNTFIAFFTIISIFVIVMLVFRSLSLPVVLVAIIQGSIWIAMSTSLLTGPMFFMSYIVATCILMGATIDYGILMSTNYIQYRNTLDKKEALYLSVASAMPTVFTSGLILTICGLVIGFISSQNAIATVGILIGKGTLVSVLMITLVLPSLLCLLDGFILKLTVKGKNKND